MKGQSLWQYEDLGLVEGNVMSEVNVRFFVNALLEATSEKSNLQDQWTQEALTWAMESKSKHLAGRSLQVKY